MPATPLPCVAVDLLLSLQRRVVPDGKSSAAVIVLVQQLINPRLNPVSVVFERDRKDQQLFRQRVDLERAAHRAVAPARSLSIIEHLLSSSKLRSPSLSSRASAPRKLRSSSPSVDDSHESGSSCRVRKKSSPEEMNGIAAFASAMDDILPRQTDSGSLPNLKKSEKSEKSPRLNVVWQSTIRKPRGPERRRPHCVRYGTLCVPRTRVRVARTAGVAAGTARARTTATVQPRPEPPRAAPSRRRRPHLHAP